MDQEREHLLRELAFTTRSLKDNLDRLQEHALTSAESARASIEEVTHRVKQGVENLSLSRQMEKHPGTVLAASVGAGIISGFKLAGKRHARKLGSAVSQLPKSALRPTLLQLAAPIVLRVGVGVLGDWLAKKYPKSEPYISAAQKSVQTLL